MKFPTERFDDISAIPKQVQAQAMTPLCHTSVSKWTMAAGAEVTSKEKKERCAKVRGKSSTPWCTISTNTSREDGSLQMDAVERNRPLH